MDTVVSKITDMLETETALTGFVAEVQKLVDSFYMSNKANFLKQLGELNDRYNNILTTSGLVMSAEPVSEEAIVDKLKKLGSILKNTGLMHITLAFSPTSDFTHRLSAVLKSYTPGAYVIAFEVDPTILGGLKVTYNGSYQDLSVSKSLETYISQHKSNVLSKL